MSFIASFKIWNPDNLRVNIFLNVLINFNPGLASLMDAATNELYTKIGHYDKRIRPYEKGSPVGVKEKFFLTFMVFL